MTNPFETEMESKIENFTTNSFKLTQMTTKNDESSTVAFGNKSRILLNYNIYNGSKIIVKLKFPRLLYSIFRKTKEAELYKGEEGQI